MYGRRGEDHPAYGRVDSDETNQLRSIAKKGSNNPMKVAANAKKVSDTMIRNQVFKGNKNPNHDDIVYAFEHIETGLRYHMTRYEFKQLNLIFKTGVDRIARGQLKTYKGWRVAKD
jgi:hypothetical protein